MIDEQITTYEYMKKRDILKQKRDKGDITPEQYKAFNRELKSMITKSDKTSWSDTRDRIINILINNNFTDSQIGKALHTSALGVKESRKRLIDKQERDEFEEFKKTDQYIKWKEAKQSGA